MMPAVGMPVGDVAKRINRIKSAPGHPQAKANIISSLRNQCRLAGGEASLTELDAKTSVDKKASSFSGAGNKQCGIGEGHKLGDGHWRLENGTWIKVD